ncbi:MAG: DEAD/DEAH box helicase, partial [Peptococcaceae bacterium]|nr:DEAD/DEAH box helicase [Peptococcaceae bacterium]
EGGDLAQKMSNYQYRSQQKDMLELTTKAFSDSRYLMIEAPTGVGKSLAYLIPAVCWAKAFGHKVLVATHTIALQEQLYTKEIAFLREVLPFSCQCAMLKGRGNYLCLSRWREVITRGSGLIWGERILLARLAVWLAEGARGDMDSIFLLGPEREWFSQMASSRETCQGNQCQYFRECFFQKARSGANSAQIVIINHALLLSGSRHGEGVLPKASHLIIDEAHHLEDEGIRYYTDVFSVLEFERKIQQLHRRRDVFGRSGFLQYIKEYKQSGLRALENLDPHLEGMEKRLRAVMKRINSLQAILQSTTLPETFRLKPGSPRGDKLQALLTDMDNLLFMAKELKASLDHLGRLLQGEEGKVFEETWLKQQLLLFQDVCNDIVLLESFLRGVSGVAPGGDLFPEDVSDEGARVSSSAALSGDGGLDLQPAALSSDGGLDPQTADLPGGGSEAGVLGAGTKDSGGLDASVTSAGAQNAGVTNADATHASVTSASAQNANAQSAGVTGVGITNASAQSADTQVVNDLYAGELDVGAPDEMVYWVTRDTRLKDISLCLTPLNIAACFQRYLFEGKDSVVFTSATLSVNGGFDYCRQQLGIDPDILDTMILSSPFRYDEQVLLLSDKDMPDPSKTSESAYNLALAESLKTLLEACGGRTMALFTSHKQLKAMFDALHQPLSLMGLELFADGQNGSRSTLLEELRTNEKAVVFGANTFWEGVDLPGSFLTSLMIVRLPFSPPGQPLTEARLEKLEAEGKDPFYSFSLPQAVLRFKQGYGRLIRTVEDWGVVVVLDNRIINKTYGKVFLRSLPDGRCQSGSPKLLAEKIRQWRKMKTGE